MKYCFYATVVRIFRVAPFVGAWIETDYINAVKAYAPPSLPSWERGLKSHNGTECDGWLINHKKLGRLLFITDAEYCPYDFSKMGITHAMIECNYSEDYIENDAENLSHVLRGHMELQTCKRLIQTIESPELRSVGLIHLSGQNSDSERFRQEIKEIVDCDVNVWTAEKGFETELSLEPF